MPQQRARGNAKIVRWIDLLAALLDHHQAVSYEQLTQLVPAYLRTKGPDARRRTFERDKDELRSFGVPIETEKDGAGEVRGYRLRREHFYLPYLSVLQDGKPSKPNKVDRYGYRSLEKLSFEPEELEAVREAALRVRRLGVPALVELAQSAMRKLAFDLPVDVDVQSLQSLMARESMDMPMSRSRVLRASSDWSRREIPAPMDAAEVFEVLETSLRARKRVTITYTTLGTGATAERDVLPYGLFFLGHHWYLAAKDAGAAADAPVKNFRLSRIAAATMNKAKPGSPDYEIPASFVLAQHARSREAWELGDTATVEAEVRFTGESGPTMAARRLGTPVAGEPASRRFQVRRLETFARWLLSFAGEAEPVSPPELLDAYHRIATATLAAYAEA